MPLLAFAAASTWAFFSSDILSNLAVQWSQQKPMFWPLTVRTSSAGRSLESKVSSGSIGQVVLMTTIRAGLPSAEPTDFLFAEHPANAKPAMAMRAGRTFTIRVDMECSIPMGFHAAHHMGLLALAATKAADFFSSDILSNFLAQPAQQKPTFSP